MAKSETEEWLRKYVGSNCTSLKQDERWIKTEDLDSNTKKQNGMKLSRDQSDASTQGRSYNRSSSMDKIIRNWIEHCAMDQ